MKFTFHHYICRVCGLAWKERGSGRHMAMSCPRCNTIVLDSDKVKESEEDYGQD